MQKVKGKLCRLIKVFEQVLRHFRKCNFLQLLRHHCPIGFDPSLTDPEELPKLLLANHTTLKQVRKLYLLDGT